MSLLTRSFARLIATLCALLITPWPVWAAVAFGSLGASNIGTAVTTLNIQYPAGISAGDLLVMCVGIKYPGVTVTNPPSPWVAGVENGTQSGAGASGVDSGSILAYVWMKEADGSETGDLVLSFTSVNSIHGKMYRYTKAGGTTWSYSSRAGGDTSGNTSLTFVPSLDVGVTAGDMVLSCGYSNTDMYTYSGHSFTQTGVTFAAPTERNNALSSAGDDMQNISVDVVATAGTSSTPLNFTTTASGSATSRPAGIGMQIRMREVAGSSSGWPQGSQQLLLRGAN